MSGIKVSIFREGVSKENRSLPALDPGSVQLNDRSIPDLLAYTRSIANQIAFYNIINSVDGDWQPFFAAGGGKPQDNYLDYLLDLPDQSYGDIVTRNTPPHFAVFLTFLALLQKLKTSVNNIPGRHFDF